MQRVLPVRGELPGALAAGYIEAFVRRVIAWRHLMSGGGSIFDPFTYLQAALLAKHLLPSNRTKLVARPLVAPPKENYGRLRGTRCLRESDVLP